MSIKIRLAAMEKMMVKAESFFRIDPVTGWFVIGGGKKAAGCLFTPPVLSPDEWLAAGTAAEKPHHKP